MKREEKKGRKVAKEKRENERKRERRKMSPKKKV
jgi:hypothetical protein